MTARDLFPGEVWEDGQEPGHGRILCVWLGGLRFFDPGSERKGAKASRLGGFPMIEDDEVLFSCRETET